MLIEELSEEELDLMEGIYDPICLAETLFHDCDNKYNFDFEKFGNIRLFQLPMLNFSYSLSDDPNLSRKENFQLLCTAGQIINLGARLYGKTAIAQTTDICCAGIVLDGWNTGFSSIDGSHVNKIGDEVKDVYDKHPIVSQFKESSKGQPNYKIKCKNGFSTVSINMNISSRNPGQAFVGLHLKALWIDEDSYETEQVNKLRRESKSEMGILERISGMTNFTKDSPVGKLWDSPDKQVYIINYPQFVNADKWDDKERKQAIEDYGSEQAPEYKVFVLGEVVADGISAFDMQRVRNCIVKDDIIIKTYAVNKESYKNWDNIIIVDRPIGMEEIFIDADVADKGQTDIVIIGKKGHKFHYLYNITLFNLIDREQIPIFKYLIDKLSSNFCGLDCTEGVGRSIFNGLKELGYEKILTAINFNGKIPVDFLKDSNGNTIFKDGQPIYKEENAVDWSIQRLRDIFYNEKISMPMDYRLYKQLNSVRGIQGKARLNYHCLLQDDHLFQAFQVFAVASWLTEFLGSDNQGKIEWSSGISGIAKGA